MLENLNFMQMRQIQLNPTQSDAIQKDKVQNKIVLLISSWHKVPYMEEIEMILSEKLGGKSRKLQWFKHVATTER